MRGKCWITIIRNHSFHKYLIGMFCFILEARAVTVTSSVFSRFKVQGFFICHMINYTGYNQKWNVGQIRKCRSTSYFEVLNTYLYLFHQAPKILQKEHKEWPSEWFKVQGFFICHMINYTGYNQKWNVGQIRKCRSTSYFEVLNTYLYLFHQAPKILQKEHKEWPSQLP